jgi:hypothetical protein
MVYNPIMKNETIRITDKSQLADAIIAAGVECLFGVADTETPVKMPESKPTGRKVASAKTGKPIREMAPNPYLGTMKIARRNFFINANFAKACEKRYAELNGLPKESVEYTPGETHYIHCQTTDGKPLALCHLKTDPTRQYLQVFPLRNLGETVYVSPSLGRLTKEQIKDMYKNWVTEQEQEEWKPRVIILKMDSIRTLSLRRVKILNDTVSRLAGRLARFKGLRVSTAEPLPVVAIEA